MRNWPFADKGANAGRPSLLALTTLSRLLTPSKVEPQCIMDLEKLKRMQQSARIGMLISPVLTWVALAPLSLTDLMLSKHR